MKIAVWHNLPSGGAKRQLDAHIKGLLARGHTVEAWTTPAADQTHLSLSRHITEHVVACAPIRWVPMPETRRLYKISSHYRYTRNKIRAMDEHCARCAVEIQGGGFDLMLVSSCQYVRVPSIARRVTLPSVMYLNEPNRALYEAAPSPVWAAPAPMPSHGSPDAWLAWLTDAANTYANRILVREEFLNAQAMDALLVNSAFSRESVLRAYGLPSRVCYLGVDTKLFRPTGVPRERFVLGLGAIHPDKALERAVRGIGAVPPDRRPPLVWVGNFANPGYKREIETLAAQLGVTFQPQVAVQDEVLVDLLNRAALLLYTPRLEPFGLAPLEANACETPAVVVAEGGIRETVFDGLNGLVVPDDDPAALGAAVSRLLEDAMLARKLGAQAREYVVNRWTWDAAVERLEHELQKVL